MAQSNGKGKRERRVRAVACALPSSENGSRPGGVRWKQLSRLAVLLSHLALVSHMASCASAPHPILRANKQLSESIAVRDMATLESLVAPDFRFETEDGSTGDREVWLGSIRDLPYAIKSITHVDLKLTVEGDSAVLCGVQKAHVLMEGETLVDDAAFCDRWDKRGDRWLITFAGVPDLPR